MIEIMLVLGILTFIFGLFFSSADTLKSYYFISEEKLLASILRAARNRAINNLNQSPHGIFIDDNAFILFEGNLFDPENPANENFDRNQAIQVTVPFSKSLVTFENLTGIPSETGEIFLTDNIRTSIIRIQDEGKIEW